MAIWKILEGKAVRFDEESGLSNIDDVTVNFSEAETRENISPTDTMKIILGKIMKWLSDLSGGAASTLLGQNLTAGKVLVSDADGKVSASETDANEIVYFYGSSDEVNAALEAGELEAGANIYCEGDTEFEPNYNITEDRAVITNADGEISPSETTAQELEYLSGVTGNVQEQIDALSSITQKITISPTLDWASSANIELAKLGKLVQILIEVNNVTLPSANNIITKIPEEYLPLGYTYIPLISQIESFGSYYYIDLSGNVILFANNGSGVTRWLTASWIYIAK